MKIRLEHKVYKGVAIHLSEKEVEQLLYEIRSNFDKAFSKGLVTSKLVFLLSDGAQTLKAL